MKKLVFISLLLLVCGTLFGQRFAYVDTEAILQNMKEYQDAQKELDALSEQFQNTLEAKYAEIDELMRGYKAEKILMTDDMRKQKEEEIAKKEKEARDYQRQKFGVEGELFKKRVELVKPIQDKLYDAIQDVAKRGNFSIIFDIAGQSNILFYDPKLDKSDDIIRKLGIKKETE
jgi:outer membrane protein